MDFFSTNEPISGQPDQGEAAEKGLGARELRCIQVVSLVVVYIVAL